VAGATRRKRVLSTRRVVFLVVAAAAPMAAIAGNAPLALVRGDGISLPAAYVVAAAVLLCFAAGYAAMSQRVVNDGAFYVFVARGLGKPPAVATAYVGALGYVALAVGLSAAFGYFTSLVLAESDLDVPWGWLTAAGVVIVTAFGHRSADVSARFLGVLMVLEFAVLLVLDVVIVGDRGTAAFPLGSFAPAEVFGGSLGIALMFAFTSFVGFESAVLYGEETKDPARSIPRALYVSVTSIAVFYVLTAWVVIGGAGGAAAPERAREDLGNLVFTLAEQYGGTVLLDASAVLLCTSVLASWIALHNAASRYLFALGWEQVAPRALGRYHPVHQSPHIASGVVTAVTVAVVGLMGLAGADPYEVIASAIVGMGTLSIVLVQAFTALAVLVFFRRRRDRRWFAGAAGAGDRGGRARDGVRPRLGALRGAHRLGQPAGQRRAAADRGGRGRRRRHRPAAARAASAGLRAPGRGPEPPPPRPPDAGPAAGLHAPVLRRRRRAVRDDHGAGAAARGRGRSTGTSATRTSAGSGIRTTPAARCTRAATSSARATPAASTARRCPGTCPTTPAGATSATTCARSAGTTTSTATSGSAPR
jgi:amino acid transporter